MDPIKDGVNWYVYCENNPLKFVDPDGLLSRDKNSLSCLVNTYTFEGPGGGGGGSRWGGGFNPAIFITLVEALIANVLNSNHDDYLSNSEYSNSTENEVEAEPETMTDGAGALKGNGDNFVTRGKGRAPKIGQPNSIYEQIDDSGIVRSRTYYDENGHSFSREDFDHSHGGMQPHEHQRTYNEDGQPITKETVKEIGPENQ
jgi:hypothetical protein